MMRFARNKGKGVLSLGVLCALVMPMTNTFGVASALGQVCGNEICEAGEDCESCPADCGPCGDIPTVSEWGLIVMLLLALTAGTIVFARRRRPAVA